jgi:hypothetical protein
LLFVAGAGVLSFAVRRSLPQGGILRLLLWFFLGSVFYIWIVFLVASLPLVIISGGLAFALDDAQGQSGLGFEILLNLWGPIICALVGWRVWRHNIQRLGSVDMWEKLRRKAESE